MKKRFYCDFMENKIESIRINNEREKLGELEQKYNTIRSEFNDDLWNMLSKISDFTEPKFWEQIRYNGYSENDIAFYYLDIRGVEPKIMIKFISLCKLKIEIDTLRRNSLWR